MMDIEKLEKLGKLKEQEILSKEEFDKMKQALLSDNTGNNSVKAENNKKKGTNWKNLGISFLITTVLYIPAVLSGSYSFSLLFNAIMGLIYTILSIKYKTNRYENCASAGCVFLSVLLLGFIAIGIITYQLLQIMQSNAILKKEYKKEITENISEKNENNIITLLLLIGICIFIGISHLIKSSQVNFACDKSSMQAAEDLINKTYQNYNNAFRLFEPSLVEYSENHLKCKAKTNFHREFPEINYELDKHSGQIFISINIFRDKFQQEIEKLMNI